MATSTTTLPTDPAARASLYLSRLNAQAAAGKPLSSAQEAAYNRYAEVAARGSAGPSSAAPSVTPISGYGSPANPISAPAGSGIGYGPAGAGTWQQQALVNAGNQVWVGPGATAPAPGLSASQALAGALPIIGLTPSTPTLALDKTGKIVGSTIGQQLGLTGTPTGLPTGAPATSGGGGVPTPVQAGQPNTLVGGSNASPYVPSVDMSGGYASVGGGAGPATGTGTWGSSSSGSGSWLLVGVAGLGAYMLLRGKGKGRKK